VVCLNKSDAVPAAELEQRVQALSTELREYTALEDASYVCVSARNGNNLDTLKQLLLRSHGAALSVEHSNYITDPIGGLRRTIAAMTAKPPEHAAPVQGELPAGDSRVVQVAGSGFVVNTRLSNSGSTRGTRAALSRIHHTTQYGPRLQGTTLEVVVEKGTVKVDDVFSSNNWHGRVKQIHLNNITPVGNASAVTMAPPHHSDTEQRYEELQMAVAGMCVELVVAREQVFAHSAGTSQHTMHAPTGCAIVFLPGDRESKSNRRQVALGPYRSVVNRTDRGLAVSGADVAEMLATQYYRRHQFSKL